MVALSFCLSLMFPTIYGVALKGSGRRPVRRRRPRDGHRGRRDHAAGTGQAPGPTSAAISFVVPAVCFAVVGLYALYDLRAAPGSDRESTEPGLPGDAGPSIVTGSAYEPPAPRGRGSRGPRAHRGRLRRAEADERHDDTRQLEVVSWWTSGSEAAALNVLFAAMHRKSDVDTVNAAVAGGAGSERSWPGQTPAAGNPPDVWQTFAGKSVQGYADRGVIRDVASVFTAVTSARRCSRRSCVRCTHDGKPYGVPTAHIAATCCGSTRAAQPAASRCPPATTPSTPSWTA